MCGSAASASHGVLGHRPGSVTKLDQVQVVQCGHRPGSHGAIASNGGLEVLMLHSSLTGLNWEAVKNRHCGRQCLVRRRGSIIVHWHWQRFGALITGNDSEL